MSLLWRSAAAFQFGSAYEDASPESRQQRLDRVRQFVDRMPGQDEYGHTVAVPDHMMGQHEPPSEFFQMPMHHLHHIPLQDISLNQDIKTNQPHVYRDVLHEKLDGQPERPNDPDGHHQPNEPFFHKLPGQRGLLLQDGNHRLMRARLMGEQSVKGRVLDWGNRAHTDWQNCPQCRQHKTDCPECNGSNRQKHLEEMGLSDARPKPSGNSGMVGNPNWGGGNVMTNPNWKPQG